MRVLKPLNVSVCEFQNRTVCVCVFVCVFVCVCVKFVENESVKFVFERVDTVHTTVHSLQVQRRSCDVCLRGLNSIEARGVLFQRLSSSRT